MVYPNGKNRHQPYPPTMTIHPSIKILVLMFSLGLASLMTWQLTKNIQEPKQKPTPEKQETSTKDDPVEKDDAQAIHIGPKSAGAIDVDLKDLFPTTPEDPNPEEEDEEKPNQQPLLPGSKSKPILPSSKSITMPLFQKKDKEDKK